MTPTRPATSGRARPARQRSPGSRARAHPAAGRGHLPGAGPRRWSRRCARLRPGRSVLGEPDVDVAGLGHRGGPLEAAERDEAVVRVVGLVRQPGELCPVGLVDADRRAVPSRSRAASLSPDAWSVRQATWSPCADASRSKAAAASRTVGQQRVVVQVGVDQGAAAAQLGRARGAPAVHVADARRGLCPRQRRGGPAARPRPLRWRCAGMRGGARHSPRSAVVTAHFAAGGRRSCRAPDCSPVRHLGSRHGSAAGCLAGWLVMNRRRASRRQMNGGAVTAVRHARRAAVVRGPTRSSGTSGGASPRRSANALASRWCRCAQGCTRSRAMWRRCSSSRARPGRRAARRGRPRRGAPRR